MHNPFWDYSLANYRLEQVAATCLSLQDSHGLDINLLLYAGWLARLGERMEPDHLAGVQSCVADWREAVLLPLRCLRQQWRGNHRAQSLRAELQRIELRAEREQQDLMYAFHQQAPRLPRAPDALSHNLALVAGQAAMQTTGCEAGITKLSTLLS